MVTKRYTKTPDKEFGEQTADLLRTMERLTEGKPLDVVIFAVGHFIARSCIRSPDLNQALSHWFNLITKAVEMERTK